MATQREEHDGDPHEPTDGTIEGGAQVGGGARPGPADGAERSGGAERSEPAAGTDGAPVPDGARGPDEAPGPEETGSPEPDSAPGPAARTRTSPRQGRSGSDVPPSWLRTSAIVVGALLLIVLLVLVAAATLPSWWASTVGRQVDGVAAAGILWGLAYGIGFTLVPLALVLLAVRARWHWKVRLGIGAGALLVLLPNLLTLAVSLGATENTRAARTLLAVQAPNFRGATVVGVIGTAVVGAGVALLVYRMTASRRELAELRKQAKEG